MFLVFITLIARAGLIHPLHLTPSHFYQASIMEQGAQSDGCALYMFTLSVWEGLLSIVYSMHFFDSCIHQRGV